MNEKQKRYQPLLALVNGYLPDIDLEDKFAKRHGLHRRYAIALHTYNPETGDTYFDVDMFVSLFKELTCAFIYDRFVILDGKKVLYSFNTFADAVSQINSFAGTEDRCYSRFHFYRAERLCCAVATEFYISAGGPWPYHDTYNFAIFMKQIPEQLTNRLQATCARKGYHIREILTGNERPSPPDFWARLKRWF